MQAQEYVKKKLEHAGIAGVEIERAANKAKVNIYTARPGIVIGKRGAGIETLKKEVQALTENEVFLNIQEVRKAETNAQLVAENIATQLERRVAFRRAMKKAVADGDEVRRQGHPRRCSGRLGGAEMARFEWYREGRVPLHTLRADIEYGFAEAHTTYGIIGVKCWIFKGEVLPAARSSRLAYVRRTSRTSAMSCCLPSEPSTASCRRATTRHRQARRATSPSATSACRRCRAAASRRARSRPPVWRSRATSSAAASSGSASSRTSRSRRSRPKPEWVTARAASRSGPPSCVPGRVMYEIEGVDEKMAREAFRLAAAQAAGQTHVRLAREARL